MFLMKQDEGKDRHKQSSYWKYAYQNIAGVEEVSLEEDKFRRIDSYWNDISRIQDESTGKLKYEKLSKLALGIFVIPIANPAPERGFSINKIMLQIHGSSLDDETIVAIRFVKDHIIKCGGVMNVKISKDLLRSVQSASQRYLAFLDEKRKNEKKEEEEKKRKELEAAEYSKKNEELEKKKAEREQHEKDKSTLKDGIAIAEEVLDEINAELGKHLAGKTVDTKKIKRCHSKLSMAMSRKRQLESEVAEIEKKIQKLDQV